MKNKVFQYSPIGFIKNLLMSFILFSMCSCLKLPSKPIMIDDLEDDKPFVHIVSSKGETFGAISEWYTGNFDNWRTIAAFNGRGKSSLLRLKDRIVIPKELLTRTDAFRSGQKAAAKTKNNSTLMNTKSTGGTPAEIKSIQNQSKENSPVESKSHDIVFEDEPSQALSKDKLDLDELSKMDDISNDEDYDSIEFIDENVVVVPSPTSLGKPESGKYSQGKISDISSSKGSVENTKSSIPAKTESGSNLEEASIEENERIKLLRELLSQ